MAEDKYNQLLNSMYEGFCVIDVIFDDAGKPIDWRYLETNQQYLNQGGIPAEAGQLVSEICGGTESFWVELYGSIAVSGIPARIENEFRENGKWFDIYAYKIGGNESRRVGVLCRDISERRKTEAALRESEQRFRSVLDNSIDIIYRINLQTGHFDYVSPSAEKITGYTPEQYIDVRAEEVMALIHPDDLPVMQTALTRLCETENEKAIYRQRTKSGEYRWLSNHMSLTGDSAGRSMYMTGNVRDITESRQTREALRASEERFRTVQDNSLDRFTILKPFRGERGEIIDFTYVYQNTQAAKTAGRSPAELVGHRMTEFFPDFPQTSFFAMYKKAAETGLPLEFEDKYHSGGENEWFRVTVTPVSDGIATAAQNITERKRAEEALQQADRNFTALFNNKTVGLSYCRTVFDENNQASDFFVIDVNPTYEFMTGIPGSQIIGRKITESIPDVTRDFIDRHNTVAVTGEESRFEYNDQVTARWYDVNVFSPQRGYFISVFFNITERKKTEEALLESRKKALSLIEELETADKSKNRFISILSHELRNPLAVIVAGLSLLEVSDRKEQILKTKDIIKRQTGQLTKLVDDLLELTRISQNKITLKKEPVDLSEIVKNTVLDYEPEYKAKGLLLRTGLPQEPVILSADPVRIAQCIGNLLQNALKFTPKTGDVFLSMETENGEAVIRVRDNGTGISPDFLTHIFEPFMQADVSLDRQSGGLGLGLCITKSVAELHGGTVSAFSEGAGKGSLFTLRLPVTDMTAEAQKSETVKKAGKAYKILLIDDNESLTEVLCSVFAIMGHHAYAARNGTEGIAEAKKIRPDIIFCDIGLPGLSGYEVAEILKADRELNKAFLIALTGYTGSEEAERTKTAGFDLHLAKPVDMALLTKILAEIQLKKHSFGWLDI